MMLWGLVDNVFSTMVDWLFFLTVVITIVIVVLDNRNPVKTLAWVLVLAFLPVVGLLFYFFFGRNTRKEKLISKKGFARLSKYPMMEYQQQKSFKEPENQHQLMHFCRRVNGALPFAGNAIDIHTEGYSMLEALLKAIASAKHHIHL